MPMMWRRLVKTMLGHCLRSTMTTGVKPRESKEYGYLDWPHEGPQTVSRLMKHMLKNGCSPKEWLSCDCMGHATCYDQLTYLAWCRWSQGADRAASLAYYLGWNGSASLVGATNSPTISKKMRRIDTLSNEVSPM